jgi:hypothetical protein
VKRKMEMSDDGGRWKKMARNRDFSPSFSSSATLKMNANDKTPLFNDVNPKHEETVKDRDRFAEWKCLSFFWLVDAVEGF